MLLDVQYVRANNQTKEPDYLYIIWKDLLTGEKKLTIVPEPAVDIQFEKPQLRTHSYVNRYEWLKNLDKRTVKYRNIIPEIAKEMGPNGTNYLKNIYETHDFSRLKDFQTYPYVFGSDFDIRSLYRIEWLNKLDNKSRKSITKGFFDIEADSFGKPGFANADDCPIDLVTIIDKNNMKSYTFALVGRDVEKVFPSGLTDEQNRRDYE